MSISAGEPGPPLHFGDFTLDAANARLSRAGRAIELAPKALALLELLARRPGELVPKDTLLDIVWHGRVVSEGAIKTVVSELRAALADDARTPRWIETVPRRGYRFVGGVRAAAAAPAAAAPGNLPAGLPTPLAREAEAAALAGLMAGQRLVTLTGTAGVGKTRLALAVADAQRAQHAGGAWLLELAPLPAEADAALLRATFARALNLAPAAAASDAALVSALNGLPLLLVVDNAEHLLEPLTPLLAQLHAQLPRLQLLVTSREPLHTPAEQILRLAPLDVPPAAADGDPVRLQGSGAMRLFVARVAARLPGFVLAPDQQPAAARLCRALDGLPLALELAAARVPVLGVAGLADHLLGADEAGARLKLLTHGARTAAPHQRTLRAALDWSHALLTPAQQRVFRRLAVFRGGFTLEAAQAVCADDELDAWAVLDALDALAQKSMLGAPAQGGAAPRFSQLESLREYAHAQLLAAGELDAVQQRHLLAMGVYWARADARALGDPAMDWLSRHSPEIDNLRAALRWGQAACEREADAALEQALLALVGHVATLWPRAGLASEGIAWCTAVRERAERQADPLLRSGVDLALAALCRFNAVLPPAEGLQRAVRAAQAFEHAGDRVRAYYANYLAWALALEVDARGDRGPYIARMQALVQPHWSALLGRFVRAAQAQEQRIAGDHAAFLAHARDELALCRRLGAQGESWSAAHSLMLAEHDRGRPEAALEIGREALAEMRAAGRVRQYAQFVSMLTTMLAQHGPADEARDALAEALPMLPTMGACEILHLAMGWLALRDGRADAAAQLLGWFESPQRGGGSYGPGTYTRRTADELGQQLEARLGAARFAAGLAAGAALGDSAAMRLGAAA